MCVYIYIYIYIYIYMHNTYDGTLAGRERGGGPGLPGIDLAWCSYYCYYYYYCYSYSYYYYYHYYYYYYYYYYNTLKYNSLD